MGNAGAGTTCISTDKDCVNCGHCATQKPEAVKNIVSSGADRIGARSGIRGEQVNSKMAGMIDHTLLKPEASREQLIKVCEEARNFNFATVCVNSSNIPLVARLLKGSQVKPIAVVGFPLGAASSQSKAFESREAIRNGAREIDMVVNIGALKSKDYKLVYDDIKAVVEASKPYKVKVIIEASDLNDEQKVIACTLSKTAEAAFVKTSTGFGKGGATIEDIKLMRRIVGSDMEVKASGGIRTTEDADKMIKAGADRIGASASIGIVTGKSAGKGTY
ncbi:MAG: deoxyribose-phosphate aldolase [bacterium]|nr:deoxyribose-phosphate aldolase [bacterium]